MEPQLLQTDYQVATTGRRFTNLLIDMILYEAGMFVLVNPLVRLIFGNALYKNFWSSYLFALIMLFLYYFVFEAAFQRTPGKFITGTKVTMEDGSEPDIAAITKRTLIRFVPLEAISMDTGKIPANKGTWWHDRWAGTRVMQKGGRPETPKNDNPQPVALSPEQPTRSYGVRLLIAFGIVILACITISSGSSLLMVVISSLIFGAHWTGNFWEDIFPFILMIAITGIGIFGISKLVQISGKKQN